MGLLKQISTVGRRLGNRRVDATHATAARVRICRFEEVEPRCVMTAAVHVGAVYYDPASGLDTSPNLIQVSFEGGAAGTELAHLTIDGNKDGGPLSFNDAIFDTAQGPLGAYGFSPLEIVQHDGFTVTGSHVDDGGTRLTLDFQGFRAGMKLVLSIDVDQVLFIDQSGNTGDVDVDAVDEGAEFQRSHFTTTFTAPHYEDLELSTLFWDSFDGNFAAAEQSSGQHLDLPPDRYTGETDHSVLTAGAVVVGGQRPLPSSIAGVIFDDDNLDNHQDQADAGIPGVTLALYRLQGGSYVATGETTITDVQGRYRFDDLAPGDYRVVETQPAGFFSVGATIGTVDGQSRGTVTSPDVLSGITLLGENSVENDFAEARPASLAGHVGDDVTGDCEANPDTPPIAGVAIELLDASGALVAATTTNAQGNYRFDNLRPGTYAVHEIQPAGYLDDDAHAGSAGGDVTDANTVSRIVLGQGVDAVRYDFCEALPVSIRGAVHAEVFGDCQEHPENPGIAGVTIELLDSEGKVARTTLTDESGQYRFDGLAPGTYGIREIQPDGYFDGDEHAGSAGGTVDDDLVTDIVLRSGVQAAGYDFCEIPPTELCGYVYSDLNNNGVRDTGEAGIAGVTLVLRDAAGQPTGLTATTDAGGAYCFKELPPGTYSVSENQPDGYFDGLDSPGTSGGTAHNPGDMITDIVLTSAADGDDYNFGELPPVSLAGYVFQDGVAIPVAREAELPDVPALRDGRLTGDDTRLAGVTLQLVDGLTGAPILGSAALRGYYPSGQPITILSDATGHFEFTGLAPGVYGVFEIMPLGYVPGIDTAGSTGGVVISPWASVDPAVLERLTAKPDDDAIIGIVLGAGEASVGNNFSVVKVVVNPPGPTPPPEPQPKVQVFVMPQTTAAGPAVLPPFVPPLEQELASIVAPFQLMVVPFVRRAGGSLYTWHLSVVNAGMPRSITAQSSVQLTSARPGDEALWDDLELTEGEWTLLAPGGRRTRKTFGIRGGTPISGDFNGDGKFEMGVFKDGRWFIDLNDNGVWDEGDLWATLGSHGDLPVTGDWDGDGKTDIGIYGPAWQRDPSAIRHEPGLPEADNENTGKHKNIPRPREQNALGKRTLKLTSTGKPREDMIDHVFLYGTPGAHPVVGDWNGDGIDTVAVFRDGRWHRDVDGDGKWSKGDLRSNFGRAGDLPVVGDFNGDGIDEIGIYRNGVWYIDSNANGVIDGSDQVIRLGGPHDKPIVGDWDGDGKSEPGVYRDASPAAARHAVR